MKSFQKSLPDYFQYHDVVSILKAGGQVLQSALAQGMTADGRLLRREHDLSGVTIDVIIDHERAELHRELSDHLSPILSRMSTLSRQVGDQRSEEHTSDLQSLMSISYADFHLKIKHSYNLFFITNTNIN